MSNRTLSIDDRIYDYILSVSVDEPDLLSRLRDETAASNDYSNMQIGPEQGQFMTFLVRMMGVKNAIEIGTFTGYSSICIAQGLIPGGQLICCDDSAEWTEMAVRYWQEAGLDDRITLELRPGLETLDELIAQGRSGDFDFIFIDADKQNYIEYYERSLELIRVGGVVAVDNTLWDGAVADPGNTEPGTRAIRRFNERVRDDERVERTLLTIGDGLTLLMKRG